MTRKTAIFLRAFKASLPILMGYGTMGFAAGVVFAARSGTDCPALWSAAIGLTAFSGTIQFVIGDWFGARRTLAFVALMTLAISFRYALYGVTLAERWRGIALWKKLFLIGGLADENYALETSARFARREDFVRFCLYLTALDVAYWCVGAVCGALAGERLPIPDRGIEFVMAALFLTILTDQIRSIVRVAGAGASCTSRPQPQPPNRQTSTAKPCVSNRQTIRPSDHPTI